MGGAGGGFGGGMNMDDIFSQFEHLLEARGFGPRWWRRGRRVTKGSNLRIRLSLNLKKLQKELRKK